MPYFLCYTPVFYQNKVRKFKPFSMVVTYEYVGIVCLSARLSPLSFVSRARKIAKSSYILHYWHFAALYVA